MSCRSHKATERAWAFPCDLVMSVEQLGIRICSPVAAWSKVSKRLAALHRLEILPSMPHSGFPAHAAKITFGLYTNGGV